MIRSLLLFILMLTIGSCKTLKVLKIMKQGEMIETDFKTEVKFEYRMGLMIIPVVIKGKTYDFLVDTGAPDLVTKELAAELGLKVKVTHKSNDSQGGSENLDFAVLDTVEINGLHFLNTGAAIADLNQSNELACLHIDGFIGANLMKQAIWQIDYDKQVLTIVSSRNKLSIPENPLLLPFKPATSGTPKISYEYNGVTEDNVTFDTGSNGYFTSVKKMYTEIMKSNGEVRNTYGFGRNASGLYGNNAPDTTFFALLSVKMEDQVFPDQVIKFTGTGAKIVGNEFLKNFMVIIDWSKNEILLIKNADPKAEEKGFGFSVKRSGDKLIVGFIVHNSPAEKMGMKIGDQVTGIDTIDYTFLTDELWCDLLYKGMVAKTKNTATVATMRDLEKFEFKLDRELMFKEK